MQEYSLADLKRLFGLPPALVRKLNQAGFIGEKRYSFQDLLVLRVAGALKAAKISTSKILTALEQIRAEVAELRAVAAYADRHRVTALRGEGLSDAGGGAQDRLPRRRGVAHRHVERRAESRPDRYAETDSQRVPTGANSA